MKKILILLAVALLTGCAIFKKDSEFPPETIKLIDIPTKFASPCPALNLADVTSSKLSTVVSVVADNYALYHSCKAKVDSLQEWYKKQQAIINKLK